MRIRLLGTGSAEGWPNPWCSCGSCMSAAAQGVLRGHTSALVDDRLLIDCGGAHAALRQGASLTGVRTALVTHRHLDHHDPSLWHWRGRAEGRYPLTLVAPPLVLADAAYRLTSDITTVAARPGEELTVDGYRVRVLPAEHSEDAVLYDVTGPGGGRLLYATDTGVLPRQTVELARDRAYDVVLLELAGAPGSSHLTLATWPGQVARLRAAGAITAGTRVLAVHLGHGNPPPDELDRRLLALGARAGRDGELLDTGRDGRRVLVLGGQSSGKSAYAESRLGPRVTYVATAPPRPGDAEWSDRVAAHAGRRPATWTTVETGDVAGVLRAARGEVLVDDLGLWLTRLLDGHWDSPGARAVFDAGLAGLLQAWTTTCAHAVLVAPEVGSGVVPATSSGRLFADLLGRATQALASCSEEVVQVVAGQPRRLR